MKKIYFFCLLFICFFTVVAQVNRPVELLTAPLRDIRFFDAEAAIAFGRGTMTRTGDGGETWSVVNLGKGSLNGEAFRECAILDENTAIIIGDRATLLRTTDKGLTWQNVTIDLGGVDDVSYTGISFINDQTGYLVGYTFVESTWSTQQKLFKTIDGGQTWAVVTLFSSWEYNLGLKIKFIDDQTGFAWIGHKISKTIDGGLVWTEVQLPATTDINDFIHTLKIDNGIIVASFSNFNPFYISNDLGDSWQNIDVLSYANGFFYEDVIFEFKNNKIYVTGGSGNPSQGNFIIYDVITHELVTNPFPYDITRNNSVRFLDENTGYLITRGNGYGFTPGRKILRTVDGGVTWEEQDSFIYRSSAVQELTLKKSGDNQYVLSKQEDTNTSNLGDFHVYVSNDSGASWDLKIKEVGLRGRLLFSKGQYISYLLSVSEADILKESNDFGETWTSAEIINPFGVGFGFYKQTDENTLVKDLYSNKVYSFDKGLTWHEVAYPQVSGVVFLDIELKSENEVYCWGVKSNSPARYYLYKSANLGQTWQQIVMISDNGANTFSTDTFVGDAMAMVCTSNNKYYKVNLLESTYELIPFNHPVEGHTYAEDESFQILTDSSWLYNTGAYTGGKVIGFTNDSGTTWQDIPCEVCGADITFDGSSAEIMTTDEYDGAERISMLLPTAPIILGDRECDEDEYREYTIENVNEDMVYWTVVSGGEIVGSDEGNSIQVQWTEGGVHKLMAMRSNTYGDSRYGTAFVDVTAIVGLDDINGAGSVTALPNPFVNHITVAAGSNEIHEASIISVTGQVLYTDNPEESDFVINGLETLPKGVYFLRLKTVDGVFTKKIVKK
jgi:photosystem II stability/assembly factor-like uncharacterized protein